MVQADGPSGGEPGWLHDPAEPDWRPCCLTLSVALLMMMMTADDVILCVQVTCANTFTPCSPYCGQRTPSDWSVCRAHTHTHAHTHTPGHRFLSLLLAGCASGGRCPSGDPLHGGGLHQRQAGHGGERRSGHGLRVQ